MEYSFVVRRAKFILGENIILLPLFLFAVLSQTTAVLMPFLVSDMGYGYTEMGWPVAVGFAAAMLLRPFVGDLLDIFGVKKVFLASIIALVVGSFGLGMASSLFAIVTLRMLIAVGAAVFYTAGGILYLKNAEDAEVGTRSSLFSLVVVAPRLFTPIAALVARDYVPYSDIFFTVSVLSLIMLFFSGGQFNNTANIAKDSKGECSKQDLAGRLLPSHRKIITMFCYIGIVAGNVMVYTATIFLPVFLDKQDPHFAKLFFVVQAPLVVVARYVLRNHMPKNLQLPQKILILAAFISSLGVLSAGFFPNGFTVLASAVVSGGILALLYPGFMALLTLATPRAERARTFGIYNMAADFGAVSGLLVIGWLSDIFDYVFILSFTTAIFMIFMVATAAAFQFTHRQRGN